MPECGEAQGITSAAPPAAELGKLLAAGVAEKIPVTI